MYVIVMFIDLLRVEAVEDFLELIEKPTLPAILAQTITWVLGEYGYLSESHGKTDVMKKICNLINNTDDVMTKASCISALMKLVAQDGCDCPPDVLKLVTNYSFSMHLDVQLRYLCV